jgi:hypothetical protein
LTNSFIAAGFDQGKFVGAVGIEQIVGGQPNPTLLLDVEIVVNGYVHRMPDREVALHHPVEQPVLPPGRVGESLVLAWRFEF